MQLPNQVWDGIIASATKVHASINTLCPLSKAGLLLSFLVFEEISEYVLKVLFKSMNMISYLEQQGEHLYRIC